MSDGERLITLWRRDKHPRDWDYFLVRALHLRTMPDGVEWEPSGWTLARESDGVEAEVYVPESKFDNK